MEKNVPFGNFAIFASGTGTNALALIEKAKELSLKPSFVLVNKESSPLLEIVPEMDIPCFLVESKKKGEDLDFERKALEYCQKYNVQWLFLAGFLKILSSDFVNSFQNELGVSQILNIHPSLLPKYPGLGGYKKSWANRDNEFGHTIHLVTPELDSGPTVFQKKFLSSDYKNLDAVLESCKTEENASYQLVFQALAKNGLFIKDGNPFLKGLEVSHNG